MASSTNVRQQDPLASLHRHVIWRPESISGPTVPPSEQQGPLWRTSRCRRTVARASDLGVPELRVRRTCPKIAREFAIVMGFRWRPHECARVTPARPASESPRRTKPRAASVTYGDLRGTASASVSNASVFRLAASRMREFAASFTGEAAAAGAILGVIFAAGVLPRQGMSLAA